MNKKTVTILYWVFTVAFSGLMIYSSIGGIGPDEKTKAIFHGWLGYPIYFIQLISWAKIIGSLVILIPGLNRIKEWAYAGFTFNLISAAVSHWAVDGFGPDLIFIAIVMGVLAVSYVTYHKLKTSNS